jgi:hypothetical protein
VAGVRQVQGALSALAVVPCTHMCSHEAVMNTNSLDTCLFSCLQEFWGRIHRSLALVPSFGMPVYYESRISSTITASLVTCE